MRHSTIILIEEYVHAFIMYSHIHRALQTSKFFFQIKLERSVMTLRFCVKNLFRAHHLNKKALIIVIES
jgi:hypothetical protein